MQQFLTQQQWMLLDIPSKQKLVEVFGIERTGASEIRDNHVVSDGYTQTDLKVITLEKMSEYVGSEQTSFLRAWEITLSKINFELNPPVGEIVSSKEVAGAVEVKSAEEAVIETKEKTNDTKKSK